MNDRNAELKGTSYPSDRRGCQMHLSVLCPYVNFPACQIAPAASKSKPYISVIRYQLLDIG